MLSPPTKCRRRISAINSIVITTGSPDIHPDWSTTRWKLLNAVSARNLVTFARCLTALTLGAMKNLRDGCIVANAGHFSSEIEVEALKQAAVSFKVCRDGIKEYLLEDGKRIFLVSDGNLVNLAAGDGNPIEIMDLGLALQSLSLEQMALRGRGVPAGVHPVAPDVEQEACSLALNAWI